MQLSVRKLDQTWDVQRGAGLSSFVSGVDAVAQVMAQRIRLLQGEIFYNTTDGTPVFQSMLGQPTTSQAIALILRQRILGTPYVASIQSMGVSYSQAGRSFAFQATVLTQFGSISATGQTA